MCAHCGLQGHTIDQCFKLHGYPPGYKPRSSRVPRSGSANQASITTQFEASNTYQNAMPSQYQLTPTTAPAALGDILQTLSTSQCQQLVSYFTNQLQSPSVSTSTPEPSPGFTCCVTGSSGICCSTFAHKFGPNSWILDSGASKHITHDKSLFTSTYPTSHTSVMLPDNSLFSVTIVGTIKLNPYLTLHDVCYVRNFKFNLLYVSALLANHKYSVLFSPTHFVIQDFYKKMIGMGKQHKGLYVLNSPPAVSTNDPAHTKASCHNVSINTRHNTLGHPSSSHLAKLHSHLPSFTASSTCNSNSNPCYICPMAKQKRLPFHTSTTETSSCFELIHCDIWAPCKVPSHNGIRYFVTVVDDFQQIYLDMSYKIKI